MPKVDKLEFLDKLIADNKQILAIVQSDFQPLTVSQLDKQPFPNKWSIKQCLEHILITENIYIDQIKKIESTIEKDVNEVFRSSWLGNYFSNMMYPHEQQIKNNMATGKFMDPIRNDREERDAEIVLAEIIELKKYVISFLEKSKTLSLEKNKIQTAIPLLKFRLGNALQFITAHSLRHIVQAQKVLQTF